MATIPYVFTESGGAAVERMFRSIGRAAQVSARDTERAFRRLGGAQQKLLNQTARARAGGGRGSDPAVTAEKRRQRKIHRIVRRNQLRRGREGRRARQREAREVQRHARKLANIQVRAERRMARELSNARKQRRSRRFSSAANVLGGIGGGIARIGGLAAAAGIGVVGAAARQNVKLQDKVTRLAIKGTSGGARLPDTVALRKSIEKTAITTGGGVTADNVADALGAFVAKTGNLGKAQEFAPAFAEISGATGTDAGAIGSAAADLFEKFDIDTIDKMREAMSLLAVQGKRGAFELEDAASQFPKIAAAAQRFGLKGQGGLATLGGLSQIARRATPSGESAATAVENLFKQLIAKSGQIKKETGVEIFKDKGKTKTRDVTTLLPEIIAGAEGNLVKLQKIFDVRGIRAVSPLVSEFNNATEAARAKAKVDGKTITDQEALNAGMKAVTMVISSAMDAQGAQGEIARDLAAAQQTAGAQLTGAWETLSAEIGDQATPALIGMAKELSSFAKNTDFAGLGTAVTLLAQVTLAAATAIGLIQPKKFTPGQRDAKVKQLGVESTGKAIDIAAVDTEIAQVNQEAAQAAQKGELDPAKKEALLNRRNKLEAEKKKLEGEKGIIDLKATTEATIAQFATPKLQQSGTGSAIGGRRTALDDFLDTIAEVVPFLEADQAVAGKSGGKGGAIDQTAKNALTTSQVEAGKQGIIDTGATQRALDSFATSLAAGANLIDQLSGPSAFHE